MSESPKFEQPTTLEEEHELTLERNKYLLEYIAKDPLTGATSLAEFDTQLEQAIKMIHRGTPASLIYIDIDHFKQVNDTFGHAGGDAVLKQVCGFLMRSVRESDIVARIGGEELAILLPGSDGFAPEKAEELRAGIEKLTFPEYPKLSVTASFGVVSLDSSMNSVTARKLADTSLYEAKHGGRNQVKVYEV